MGLNIKKIELLPLWCITDKYPAFYDTESATAIEQTAKLYGAMRTLQEEYNNMATTVNATINAFINDVNADQEEFENHINKIIHDYIAMIDEKIKLQDKTIADSIDSQNEVIEDAIVYIKNNITEVANRIMREAVENGTIQIASVYEEQSKKLSIVVTNVEEGGTE